jgi:RimJ/RimL family protein N-acetyltransferase
MIEFERSTDYELIRQVMTHRRVWGKIRDDYSPNIENFRPIEHEAMWYVTCRKDGDLMGLFLFVPLNAILVEVHTCLLPVAYGAVARECGRGVAEWLWRNSIVHRIITSVPESNPLALEFAKDCGMKAFGRNPKSILKGGKLQDQIMLGLSRPAEANFSEPEAVPAEATGG